MDSILNVLNYLLFFGVDVILLLVAGFVYIKYTPVNEIALIRDGNNAAATSLGGAMIGFAVVLYSATQHGNILSTIMWAIIALAMQIAAFELLRRVLHDDWKEKIEANDTAHGVISATFSLAIGIINAGCIT